MADDKKKKDLKKYDWYSKVYKDEEYEAEQKKKQAAAKKAEEEDSVWELIKTALLAVCLALVIRTFAFEPFNIPSGSMVPTLLVGDYLFVSKYSYGYSQYAFPFGMASFDGRIFASEPERGDVAVFRQPKRPQIDYIKRIVGLPGDRIQVKEGILYVNDTPVVRDRVGISQYEDTFGRLGNYTMYREILPGGTEHNLIERSDEERLDNTPVYVVPEDHFFAMGDNRDNSQDSRVMSEVGFVPMDNLVGKAQYIFFSTDGSASIAQVWEWPSAIRWNRIFQEIK